MNMNTEKRVRERERLTQNGVLECRYRVDNIVVVEDKDVVEDENNFEHHHNSWETPAPELVYLFVKHLEFPFVYNKLIVKMLFIININFFEKQLISPTYGLLIFQVLSPIRQ